MNWKRATLSTLIMAFGLLATGCAEHRYRTYDTWGPGETVYYNQWYTETYHNEPHRDYKRLKKDEQHRYWEWRHQHGDHDRDHDRDHDHH